LASIPVFHYLKAQKMNIGLFGYGCVGQGLYDILSQTPGLDATIVKIAVKDSTKARSLPQSLFVYTPEAILNDPNIDIVIELIDDPDSAYYIGKTALEKGKHLISANKKMIARHQKELSELAESRNLAFLYEGAVCGSIPILRTIEGYYRHHELSGIRGIFNGSCNFILSLMEQKSMKYEEALELAKEAGFAESDPHLDVSGYDALYKTSILAVHAFGILPNPDQIIRCGIEHIQPHHLEFAAANQLKIKQVCTIQDIGNKKLLLSAMPSFVTQNDMLYNVDLENNAVVVSTRFSDQQFFIGKGAGSHPTGTAVFSDFIAHTQGYRYNYEKQHKNSYYSIGSNSNIVIYLDNPEKIWPKGLKSVIRVICQLSDRTIIGSIACQELLAFAESWQKHGIFIAHVPKEELSRIQKNLQEKTKNNLRAVVHQTARYNRQNCC